METSKPLSESRQEMPESLSALDLLVEDHEKVLGIFEDFEATQDSSEQASLVQTALAELTVHATIEEEIFYPAVQRELEERDIVDEAFEEHHAAKLLIAELETMTPSDDRYVAKFKVLAEMVRHHIDEEENDLFPMVEDLDIDLAQLGSQMMDRKEELSASESFRDALMH